MERQKPKKDITLMTLLAYESTGDSRKLLKKYGKPDAKNISDLEQKLADLYFNTEDKIQLEKEMADIHPHKNWIQKSLPNQENKVTIIEDTKPPVIDATKIQDHCSSCCNKRQSSNFDGDFEEKSKNIGNEKPFGSTPMDYFGPVVMLTIISFFMVIIVKTVK